MRSTSWILSTLAALALSSPAGPAGAEELEMTTAPEASAKRPARGMSMDKVEANFGAPTKRDAAVGQPPITRWDYPGFAVFFEHHLVIHAVAT